MISTRLFAALAVSAGMALPAVSHAQLFGNGHMAGRGAELQSGTAASINADLSGASEARGNPADAGRGHLRQARRQTEDGFSANSPRPSGTASDARADNLRAMIDLEAKGPGTTALSAGVSAKTNDDNH
ncbi:hypothetical protein [Asticcacaulis sp. 201]|uniref:hypothetical protein n=1 Tax=Asticcacaulis sp. 201 TaxID=3028787 RepID=UPI0029168F94|nr:hypothetical protein [Asticcacaulis sp. 201]MDV6332812.1 hypothetical protein [Asticcacaulis sp. 201]